MLVTVCDMCWDIGNVELAVAVFLNHMRESHVVCPKHLKLVKEHGFPYFVFDYPGIEPDIIPPLS